MVDKTNYNIQYAKEHQKRIPINWLKDDYENRVKPAIDKSGMSVSAYFKQAVNEKIKKDEELERMGNISLDLSFLDSEKPDQAAGPKDTFVQRCIDGRAAISELDDYIEYWHTHDTEVGLSDFLGLTRAECEQWAKRNDTEFLKHVIATRIEKCL